MERIWCNAMADSDPDLLELMVALRARREAYALATVVETEGSASARPGAKALVGHDGAVLAGWVGGGCAESAVRQAALDCLRDDRPVVIDLDLNDEVLGTGMPCGGSMRVYVEPVLPRPTLWILGHGRVAECLCRFGATLGFRVVVDETPAPDPARYPDAAEIIGDDYGYERLMPAAGDAVVIATQHKGDHVSAVRALRSPAGLIAVIASRKRSRLCWNSCASRASRRRIWRGCMRRRGSTSGHGRRRRSPCRSWARSSCCGAAAAGARCGKAWGVKAWTRPGCWRRPGHEPGQAAAHGRRCG